VSVIAAPRGSTLWLVLHELKLALRAQWSRPGGRIGLIFVGAMLALAAVALGFAFWSGRRALAITPSPLVILGLDLAVIGAFTLTLSQTLSSAVMAFFERGDLELLLSSPLPPRRILTARAIAIAATPFMWLAIVLSIFIVPLAALGQLRWLSAYPVLAAVTLLASAAGISLAMGLLRLLGARRTRTVGQLLAALIGAAFFLISQARTFLPDNGRGVFAALKTWAESGALAKDQPLAWPARALLGEPAPLVGFVALSVVAFVLVVGALGRRFASDASVAAGAAADVRVRASGPVALAGFRGGLFAIMIRKELRILVRDPTLLSQVLLRTLYVLPMTFLLIRGVEHPHTAAGNWINHIRMASIAGAIAFTAGQVAGSLAWIIISAEDAPELLAAAPVDGQSVRRAKLIATMIPVVLLLIPPLGAIVWLSPWIGLAAVVGALASMASAGLVNLWFEKPVPRKNFRNRRGASVTGTLAELFICLGWGVSTGFLAAGSAWGLIPAAVTLIAMGVLYGVSEPDQAY